MHSHPRRGKRPATSPVSGSLSNISAAKVPLTAALSSNLFLPRLVLLGVALFERRSYGRKPSVCGLQGNQVTRPYRGRPRPVSGESRPGEPSVAQGELSVAVAL